MSHEPMVEDVLHTAPHMNFNPRMILFNGQRIAVNISWEEFIAFFGQKSVEAIADYYDQMPAPTREEWAVAVTGIGQRPDGQFGAIFLGMLWPEEINDDVTCFMLSMDADTALRAASWANNGMQVERERWLDLPNGAGENMIARIDRAPEE